LSHTWLHGLIVQLRLHRGRRDLNHTHISLLQVAAQRDQEVVQRRLSGAISRAPAQGHDRKARGGVHQGGRLILSDQEGEECRSQVDGRCVICDQFCAEYVEVHGLRLREVEATLDTGVDEDRVEIGVLASDSDKIIGSLCSYR
jgi:hypothetical protein